MEPEEEEKKTGRQFKLYRFLLEKYADLINESEKKTIGEIKGLVNENDLTVQSILSEFRPEDYDFERDYLKVLEKVFAFLHEEIGFVEDELEINFWLTPKEILDLRLSDDDAFSVLLCTFMAALGDKNAFVVVAELDNLSTHAFAVTEFNKRFVLLDPSQDHSFNEFIGEKAEVMQKYSFKGAKIKRFLYKFNAEEYEHFLETT